MNRYKDSFNPKWKIRICSSEDALYLKNLQSKVSYGGNPQHKRNPGDFGLKPPAEPRPAKSLCDAVGVFKRSEALALLRKGIAQGLVSARTNDNGFPQNIWSVIELADGRRIPLESQIENPLAGAYHGYPLPQADPMHDLILEKWRVSKCLISK